MSYFDIRNINYVAQMWKGIGDTLIQKQEQVSETVPQDPAWAGDRAERFRKWWWDVIDDIGSIRSAAWCIGEALSKFATRMVTVNEEVDYAYHVFRQHCYNIDERPPYFIFGTFDDGDRAPTVSIDHFDCTIDGLGGNPWPAAWSTIWTYMNGAKALYWRASNEAATYMAPAKRMLDSTTKVLDIHRSSALERIDPTGANDPNWAELTGGGIYRPAAPGQFVIPNPYGTAALPAWFEPPKSTLQQIHDALGWFAIPLDITAVFVATFNPEFLPTVVGITAVVNGTKSGIDVVRGDGATLLTDGLDLVLVGAGLQNLAEAGAKALLSKAGFDEATHRLSKEEYGNLVGTIAAFIQNRTREKYLETPEGLKGSGAEFHAILEDASGELQIQLAAMGYTH